MKKKIFIASLLAVALSLTFVMPVAAGDSNVVINESSHLQSVDRSVYDGEDGYYEITRVLHDNRHGVLYSDDTVANTRNVFTFMSAEGEGIDGPSVEYDRHRTYAFNDNTGNGLVSHYIETTVREDENTDTRYHAVMIFANGEERAYIVTGEAPPRQ